MSDQIIDQVESIATTFDKPAENVIFMKELLVKTKPLKPGIEFDNFHVAMSKNGGFVAFVKKSSYFIMELPQYKVPSIKRATVSMFERGKAFIVKAGTIILLCNTVIQIMQSFNWQFQLVAEGAENTSILATIASPFAFILIPLGFGAWQLAAAAITGFIAKENVVGTLAVCFVGLENLI